MQPIPASLFAPGQLITDPAALVTFEIDAGLDRGHPEAVFYPTATDEVSRLLQWAHGARVPIVARGAGTGLSGGAVAEQGGILVAFARMNRLLALDTMGRSATVESGLVNLKLDGAAKATGLYFPPDPSSGRSAVLGGNVGENSGGPHCFKYGVTTNYVTGLEAVLADGTIIRTGGRALDYPEYDFTGLLVGSEGTLGLVTRIETRLLRNPPAVKTLMVSFHSGAQAGAAVSAIIAAGLVPATLEMMDRKVMGMIEAYVQIGLPVTAAAALIVEVDGYASSLDSQMGEITDLLTAHGGYDLRIAQSEEERQQLWYGRKSAAGAFARLAPAFYLVDVTVPRSFLAETLAAIDEILARLDLQTGHVFHAGDGNLHPCILIDPKDPDLMQRTMQACEEIVHLCVARDGSITGEHGVGIEKRDYMPMMYTGAELAAMHDVKQVFDPGNLLNPGKIFPRLLPPVEPVAPVLPAEEQFAPASAQEAAAGLAAATVARRPVVIGGDANGRPAVALQLVTENLRGVVKFAPDDLYVTVGAGTPLAEVQAFLGDQQLQVAVRSPWPAATVGGLAAANVNGPQRMKYGGWRDNLLCATVALADGRVIRAGRPVVKNVAGYDLPKVFVGAYGTLGLLCDVTLKLFPLPRQRRTLVVPVADPATGLAWAQATAGIWLATAGVVLVQGHSVPGMGETPWLLVMTLEGLPADVAAEEEALCVALQSAGAPPPITLDALTAPALWATFVGGATATQGLLRVGVPPQYLRAYWQLFGAAAPAGAAIWLFDVAAGLAYAAGRPDHPLAADWVIAARQPALALGGYGVVMAGAPGLAGPALRWGYRPDTLPLMHKLKARWDPAGILPTALS